MLLRGKVTESFLDLREGYESIKDGVVACVQQVMGGCRFALGENIKSFEKGFASFCGTDYASGSGDGTDAYV